MSGGSRNPNGAPYEIRPRKDHRGVDLISAMLPFGRLWYGEPDAISNAICFAKFYSRARRYLTRLRKQNPRYALTCFVETELSLEGILPFVAWCTPRSLGQSVTDGIEPRAVDIRSEHMKSAVGPHCSSR